MILSYWLLGTLFGWVLSRSGAADYDLVQRMFLFESFQLYGIIGTAVAVLAPALWLLRRRGVDLRPRPRHAGNLLGGLLFGVGWSITGMCPGPIFVNIGEGKVYALAALAGSLVGAGAFGALYPRLAARLDLPELQRGPGDG